MYHGIPHQPPLLRLDFCKQYHPCPIVLDSWLHYLDLISPPNCTSTLSTYKVSNLSFHSISRTVWEMLHWTEYCIVSIKPQTLMCYVDKESIYTPDNVILCRVLAVDTALGFQHRSGTPTQILSVLFDHSIYSCGLTADESESFYKPCIWHF